jgi:hypothetical protein
MDLDLAFHKVLCEISEHLQRIAHALELIERMADKGKFH